MGLHCHEHVRHSSRSLQWIRRDASRALKLMASIGVRPSLWRTPWGDTTARSQRVAQENGLQIVGWTVDTHDWRSDSAEEMFRLTAPGLLDRAIVLAHDGIGPGALRGKLARPWSTCVWWLSTQVRQGFNCLPCRERASDHRGA